VTANRECDCSGPQVGETATVLYAICIHILRRGYRSIEIKIRRDDFVNGPIDRINDEGYQGLI